MSKKELYTSPLVKDNCNPHIHISSIDGRSYKFLVSVDHDGIEKDVFARIYTRNKKWYIWYEKACYRTEVNSFSTAVNLIENEVMSCVA